METEFLVWENYQKHFQPSLLGIFDRDNTLIFDEGYVHQVAKLQLKPKTIDAMLKFKESNGAICIVTNQGGLALNRFTYTQYQNFNSALIRELKSNGIQIDFVLACPHHPLSANEYLRDCNCRKPQTAMLNFILSKYNLDKSKIAMFGDLQSDMDFAAAGGIEGFLVSDKNDLLICISSWLKQFHSSH